MLPTSTLIIFLTCSNYFDFTFRKKKEKRQVLLTEHMQAMLQFCDCVYQSELLPAIQKLC